MKLRGCLSFAMLLAAAVWVMGVAGYADSRVRIVRLSAVEGQANIERNVGDGWEKAMPNLPVVEGAMLRTGSDGRMEVEFEQGTMIRLVPNSELKLLKLSRRGRGTG